MPCRRPFHSINTHDHIRQMILHSGANGINRSKGGFLVWPAAHV